MPHVNQLKLLELIREGGWNIKRQEGHHYIVVHPVYGRTMVAVPSGSYPLDKIMKKLHIKEIRELSRFRSKDKSDLAALEVDSYGYNLYMARAGHRYTQQDLSVKTGISKSALMMFEMNLKLPSKENQEFLAKVLDFPGLVVETTVGSSGHISTIPATQYGIVKEAVAADPESHGSSRRMDTEPEFKTYASLIETREALAKMRANKTIGKKVSKRGPYKKKIKPSLKKLVDFSLGNIVTHEEFNNGMLDIRTYVTILETQVGDFRAKAEKWDAIKDLIKED